MPDMTIGKLAKAAEVPVSTLRYYERRGLVRPSHRTRGNYRLFDANTVDRVRFIRRAQANGFTLDDVQTLIQLLHAEKAPCGEVRDLIETRLATVQLRLQELRRLEETLEEAFQRCLRSNPDVSCGVMDDLLHRDKTQDRNRKEQPQ